MNRSMLQILVSGVLAAAGGAAPAALVVRADHVDVVSDPPGGNTVYGFVEISVQNDNPALRLGGFQVQVRLPEFQRDVTFSALNVVSNTVHHPPLLPGEPFVSSIDSVRVRTIKTTFNPVDLIDNGGLVRLGFAVAPGIEDVFPVRVVTLAVDPDFGTVLLDGNYAPIPYTAADGSITVRIPEPAAFPALAATVLAAKRRRAGQTSKLTPCARGRSRE